MFAIGEAARLSGVSIEAIRYYEREGIVSKAGRSRSGRRVYTQADVAELRFIKRCRNLGFSVQDAIALRRLSTEQTGACDAVEGLGQQHLKDVRERIKELLQLEKALAELVSNCAAGKRDCPMLDALLDRGP